MSAINHVDEYFIYLESFLLINIFVNFQKIFHHVKAGTSIKYFHEYKIKGLLIKYKYLSVILFFLEICILE